jgi:hypothetical protein
MVDKLLIVPCQPRKPVNSVTVVGVGQSSMTCLFLGSVATPAEDIMCPKYSNSSLANSHLDSFT